MTDYISRADAIEAVVSWTVEDRPHEVMPTDLVDRIKALPSAETHEIRTETHGVCLISKDDAIETVRGLSALVEDEDFSYFEDALNALPSAELPKGDLISRADALRELNGACSNWEDDAKVAEIINALPSADAVQGEWIEAELDKGFKVCSVCKNKGYKDKMAWRTDFIKSYLNFCPNCGARMKGGAE